MSGALNVLIGAASSGLSATVSPTSALGTSTGGGTCASNVVICTARGGQAPYTYLWSETSVGSGIVISTATSYSTSFFTYFGSSPAAAAGTFKCTVTDDNGTIVDSLDVPVDLEAY